MNEYFVFTFLITKILTLKVIIASTSFLFALKNKLFIREMTINPLKLKFTIVAILDL